jgi:hypothetical protein
MKAIEFDLALFGGPTRAISRGGLSRSACLGSCVQAVARRVPGKSSALPCW